MSFMYCPSDSQLPSVLITFPLSRTSTPHFFIPNCITLSSLNKFVLAFGKQFQVIHKQQVVLNPLLPHSYPVLALLNNHVSGTIHTTTMEISYCPEKSLFWYQLFLMFLLDVFNSNFHDFMLLLQVLYIVCNFKHSLLLLWGAIIGFFIVYPIHS